MKVDFWVKLKKILILKPTQSFLFQRINKTFEKYLFF